MLFRSKGVNLLTGGGRGIRGGPGVVGQALVEDWVPVSEIGVGAKE